MRYPTCRLLCLSLLLISLSSTASPKPTLEARFDQLKKNPKALAAFIHELPIGADLHNHLPGGSYAEKLLGYSESDTQCLDQHFALGTCPSSHSLSAVWHSPSLREGLIDNWSMRHFHGSIAAAHQHFFSAFDKFWPFVRQHRGDVLAEQMTRAAHENESYLELMLMPDENQSGALGDQDNLDVPLAVRTQRLLHSSLPSLVAQAQTNMTRMEQHARDILQCDRSKPAAACGVEVRYLYHILREQPQNRIFAQLLFGFELVNKDPRFVGINMVMPEEGPIATRDYDAQMRMIEFLRERYPAVHVTLHAGELTPEIADKTDLRNHIAHAIDIAHAERIGHGFDIQQEQHHEQTLKTMAQNHIAVEICLSSNDTLLGKVFPHPLPVYLQHKVPVVLSTDDEGVLRTNISAEYLKAVQRFNLSWHALKQLDRNSLTYSFLPGKSLWADADSAQTVAACQHDLPEKSVLSAGCDQFLQANLKAKLQWQLEAKLSSFERKHLSS